MEVDSITLIDVPQPDRKDGDRNALVDTWESFYFGRLGIDALADPDGDGYVTLQEMLEVSDPNYGPDFPAVPAVDLGMPQVHLTHLGGHQFDLWWRWQTNYLDVLRFDLEASSEFSNFETIATDIVPSGDLFEVTVDGQEHPMHFFRARLRLR